MARFEEKREDLEAEKGHCPQCGPERIADIVASGPEVKQSSCELDGYQMWVIDIYRILRCRGGETVYVQCQQWFSEDGPDHERDPVTGEYKTVYKPKVTYWPSPVKRQKPDWVYQLNNFMLQDLLDEVYGALDAGHRVLAAIGTRTVLDYVMVLKGVENSNFEEKIKELKKSRRHQQDRATDAHQTNCRGQRSGSPCLEAQTGGANHPDRRHGGFSVPHARA